MVEVPQQVGEYFKEFNSLLDGQLQDGGDEIENEINCFIPGVKRFYKNILGDELSESAEKYIRNLLRAWNTFLQEDQDGSSTAAIISSDVNNHISKFRAWWQDELSEQQHSDEIKWIWRWLARWNVFLQARQGNAPVSKCDVYLTASGLLCYVVDIGSDIVTALSFAYKGEWWHCVLTLLLVYGAVTASTVWKWLYNEIHCTGPLDKFLYFSSLLVNWPDLQQCKSLLQLEWKLSNAPNGNAHLVSEWLQRRRSVISLKLTEGLLEACPQAILQLWLLSPELNGDITETVYFRIASTTLSLCTAGASLVNWEKVERIRDNVALPITELVVLHLWMLPVTVSRLLSVALLLTVHLYGALICITLHLLLYSIYWCTIRGWPRTRLDVLNAWLASLWFFISPFQAYATIPVGPVRHVIHLLCNTAVTVLWALNTSLQCTQPALYTTIITVNSVAMVLGLLVWMLYEKYWHC